MKLWRHLRIYIYTKRQAKSRDVEKKSKEKIKVGKERSLESLEWRKKWAALGLRGFGEAALYRRPARDERNALHRQKVPSRKVCSRYVYTCATASVIAELLQNKSLLFIPLSSCLAIILLNNERI